MLRKPRRRCQPYFRLASLLRDAELLIPRLKATIDKNTQRDRQIINVWYLGGDEFQSRLLQRVKRTVSQGLAASYSGAAKRAHGKREAARMLGKAALGLRAEGPRAQEPAGEAVLA